MKILVKYPSRERPQKFADSLQSWLEHLSNKHEVKWLISVDANDPQVEHYFAKCRDFAQRIALTYHIGVSESKVAAINRDVHYDKHWDILIVQSDDMFCEAQNWDDIIASEMQEEFPYGDGVLYHPDGFQNLNTMPIMGHKYYDRFGYIYHPSYKAFWCDNEFQEVADLMGRQVFYQQVLFRHLTWFNVPSIKKDAIAAIRNRYFHEDKMNFLQRKSQGFPQ